MQSVLLQVSAQLQALLAEKAQLAQENARLARENTGLQVRCVLTNSVLNQKCPTSQADLTCPAVLKGTRHALSVVS